MLPIDNPMLGYYSALLDDIEKFRISNSNRQLALTSSEEYFGKDIPAIVTDALHSELGIDIASHYIRQAEDETIKALKRELKNHYLYPWQQRQKGVGDKTLARFIASVGGDPYWQRRTIKDTGELIDRPRTFDELTAYVGLHVIDGEAVKRRKGVKSNWNTEGKTRLYLIAESCLKQRNSPYRKVYDDARIKYASPNIPLGETDGTAHRRSMRLMMKTILKDIWKEGREYHNSL